MTMTLLKHFWTISRKTASAVLLLVHQQGMLLPGPLSLSLSLSLYIYIYIHGKDKLKHTVGVDTYVSTGSSKLMMSRVV
jgi:hypothetical protein